MSPSRNDQVTIEDILTALDNISEWIQDIRGAISTLPDHGQVLTFPAALPFEGTMIPRHIGCPPKPKYLGCKKHGPLP